MHPARSVAPLLLAFAVGPAAPRRQLAIGSGPCHWPCQPDWPMACAPVRAWQLLVQIWAGLRPALPPAAAAAFGEECSVPTGLQA